MLKQINFQLVKEKIEKIKVINLKIDFLYEKEGIKEFLTCFDPLDNPTRYLLACKDCGKIPFLKYNGKIYVAVCDCRKYPLSRKKSISVPQYNKSPMSITIPYWKIPAFNIPTPEEMEPTVLREKIVALRKYFELRKELATLRRKAGYTNTNSKHINRMKAFIMWTMYLQGEVKIFLKGREK